MLSSSEDITIDLLQLLPTLSKTYPPNPVSYIALCSIYRISNKVLHIEHPYCADCGKYRLCNNRLLLKYITILCATPCHV